VDEEAVRERATMLCDALLAGDMDAATRDFSPELRRNLGEVIALLPLPATEATVDSVSHSLSGFVVLIQVVGDSGPVMLQTRWKDRDGSPVVVEVSHLSQAAIAPVEPPIDNEDLESPGSSSV